MPHLRERHCLNVLLKKLAFSPVVAIQGARQTGKSVLIRDILPAKVCHLVWCTFDSPTTSDFATSRPESFLDQYEPNQLVAIDEAQKVPAIFDVVKLRVDQNRRPGMYVLLGSTQFSTLTGIRESLTGRMSRLRVFPLTLAEVKQLKLNSNKPPFILSEKPRIKRREFIQCLNRGGLPGIFSVRSDEERKSLLQDWLALTCERDLLRLKKKSLDPVLAFKILKQVAQLPEPSAGAVARALRVDHRKVQSHLDALETLFVVQPLRPHQEGTGKTLYFVFDVGLSTLLGAGFERQLHTLLIHEIFARLSYLGIQDIEVGYYRTRKGGIVHLTVQEKQKIFAFKILAEERIDMRELSALMAWKKKNPKVSLFALGSQRISLKKEKIEIYPWESLA